MRARLFLIAALVATVAVAAGVLMMTPRLQGAASADSVGGPFQLTDQNGKSVSQADLNGRPTLMFFGFTYCPEICPTTLLHVSQWMKRLGPDADRLNVVFVSVDPERDTPAQLKLYLSNFDPRIRGFSGSAEATARIAKAYRVYYQKVPLPGGDYTLDHSSSLYLFDDRMRFVELIRYGETEANALAQINRVLAGKG